VKYLIADDEKTLPEELELFAKSWTRSACRLDFVIEKAFQRLPN